MFNITEEKVEPLAKAINTDTPQSARLLLDGGSFTVGFMPQRPGTPGEHCKNCLTHSLACVPTFTTSNNLKGTYSTYQEAFSEGQL